MVFHGSMVNWRRGWGKLTIDLYYTITPHKSAQGICAWCYMWNWCGVVVFHGSMVNWRRGWGKLTIDLYYTITPHKSVQGICAWSVQICQVWCSGIQGISAQVRGSICHRCMLHCYTFPLPINLSAICLVCNVCRTWPAEWCPTLRNSIVYLPQCVHYIGLKYGSVLPLK